MSFPHALENPTIIHATFFPIFVTSGMRKTIDRDAGSQKKSGNV